MIKKLFLSHYNGDAPEIKELAIELRLRGVVPWVDKEGGFLVADDSAEEARRAIREDCFGLLLYTTPPVFHRHFIRDVELDEAIRLHRLDDSYVLFAVPRGISFPSLKKRSLKSFGIDLSAFHTVPMPKAGFSPEAVTRVAAEVLTKVLRREVAHRSRSDLSLQYSTRELFPDETDDVLCVNATALFTSSVSDDQAWGRVLAGLRDVKREISSTYGRPRLNMHGSKHLTAAFLFGRVFAPFEMVIRQTSTETWTSYYPPSKDDPFDVTVRQGVLSGRRLFVEIAARNKNLASGVDSLVAETGIEPSVRLQLYPKDGPLDADNALGRAMVRQAYAAIERVMQTEQVAEVHLFVAAQQAFMVLLGREMKGMPETHLYEWNGSRYVHSCTVPGGVI